MLDSPSSKEMWHSNNTELINCELKGHCGQNIREHSQLLRFGHKSLDTVTSSRAAGMETDKKKHEIPSG